MWMIDVFEVVDVHVVIPEQAGLPFDFHTHGLEAFGHKEFQVLAPGYCRFSAVALLRDLADAVVNRNERFAVGRTVVVDGVTCGYQEVDGDAEGDLSRLRIIDLPGGCECVLCQQDSMCSHPEIEKGSPSDAIRDSSATDEETR